MSRAEEDRKRLIARAYARGEILIDDSGYHRYWPKGFGYVSAHHLRWIADELDRINAPWDAEVQQAMSKVNEKETRDDD